MFLLCMFKETHMRFLAYTEILYMGLVIWVLYDSYFIYMVLCVFRPKDLRKTLMIWYDMLQTLIALSQHIWISLDWNETLNMFVSLYITTVYHLWMVNTRLPHAGASIREINASFCHLTSATLQQLPQLPALERLNLDGCQDVDDEAVGIYG